MLPIYIQDQGYQNLFCPPLLLLDNFILRSRRIILSLLLLIIRPIPLFQNIIQTQPITRSSSTISKPTANILALSTFIIIVQVGVIFRKPWSPNTNFKLIVGIIDITIVFLLMTKLLLVCDMFLSRDEKGYGDGCKKCVSSKNGGPRLGVSAGQVCHLLLKCVLCG